VTSAWGTALRQGGNAQFSSRGSGKSPPLKIPRWFGSNCHRDRTLTRYVNGRRLYWIRSKGTVLHLLPKNAAEKGGCAYRRTMRSSIPPGGKSVEDLSGRDLPVEGDRRCPSSGEQARIGLRRQKKLDLRQRRSDRGRRRSETASPERDLGKELCELFKSSTRYSSLKNRCKKREEVTSAQDNR